MRQHGGRPPVSPTCGDILRGLETELEAAGLESPGVEAERLLSRATGISRSDLRLHGEVGIEPEQAKTLAGMVRRRVSGVPLQHLEGSVDFRDLTLLSDGRALIPRPETEQLVGLAVDWAFGELPFHLETGGVRRVRRPRRDVPPPRDLALDIGTGSGAIALSLVHEGAVARAIGVDVSSDALDQARENRRLSGLEDRVDFRQVTDSVWGAVDSAETFDLVISNPPYVRDRDIEMLSVEVRRHEPREALAGGSDGLDVLRELASGVWDHLRPGGALFIEIGVGQGGSAANIVRGCGAWTEVHLLPDLCGRDRFVIALS